MSPEEFTTELYRLLRRATSIPFERSIRPEVGDIVIECSRFSIDTSMIGTLDAIEGDPQYPHAYLVTSLTGEKQRWTNAQARTVEMKF